MIPVFCGKIVKPLGVHRKSLPDTCGTEDNSINLDSTQPTSMDTSVPPENVDSIPVIDISQSDEEMLSLLRKKKPRCEHQPKTMK